MSRIVSNSGPLIALALLDRLDLLRGLYDEVLIPKAVRDEVEQGGAKLQEPVLSAFFAHSWLASARIALNRRFSASEVPREGLNSRGSLRSAFQTRKVRTTTQIEARRSVSHSTAELALATPDITQNSLSVTQEPANRLSKP